VYYVDSANGSDAANGTTLSTAWKTIKKANQQLKAADTVYIRKGTYTESIAPINNGGQNQRITYAAYLNEKVLLSGVSIGINLVNRDYITVNGINVEKVDRYINLDSSRYIHIANGRFDNHNNPEGWPAGIIVKNNSHHNRIFRCVIGRVGYCTADDDKGGVMALGIWEDTSDHCDYNLLEDNVFFYGGHHIIELVGKYNVIRNNYFHNEEWMNCSQPGGKCGNRLIILGYDPKQCRSNLIEGNRFAFSGVPPDGNTSAGISMRTPHNIVRRNIFYYNDGPGLDISTSDSTYDARYNRVYHNTFFHNGFTLLSGVETWKQGGMLVAKHGNSTPTTRLSIKNNIFHDNKTQAMVFYYVSRDSQELANNREHAGDPVFEDIQSTITPENPQLPDVRLKPSSPCIDSGAFLTTIISAAGSGAQFNVKDAGYFTDGWGVIEGDYIQVQGFSERARITGINYAANVITVDRSLTWATNSGVGLAYEGKAPDIGAIEYGLNIGIKNNPSPDNSFSRHSYLKVFSGRNGVEILYSPGSGNNTEITIYALTGRLVRRLAPDNASQAGSVHWDGLDLMGERCMSGCYIIELHNPSASLQRHFTLLR